MNSDLGKRKHDFEVPSFSQISEECNLESEEDFPQTLTVKILFCVFWALLLKLNTTRKMQKMETAMSSRMKKTLMDAITLIGFEPCNHFHREAFT